MSDDSFWENLGKTLYPDGFDKVSSEQDYTEIEDLAQILSGSPSTSIDSFLQGKTLNGDSTRVVREAFASEHGVPLPAKAGTRVAFVATTESLFTYSDCPDPNLEGEVVRVRTAFGDQTAHDGMVFVLWDDRVLRPIHRSHMKMAPSANKSASASRMVVSGLGDISDLFKMKSGSTDLVHKATNEYWAVRKDGEDFVIERLFNDTGEPLKGA